MERLPDEVVDAVEVVTATDFAVRGRAPIGDEHARRVLAAFVTLDRDDADFLLEGAAQRTSRGTDGAAFAYREIPGEDGVVIEVGAGRAVLISEEAFDRLLDRLRATIASIDGA